jgi:hypothetical protein
MSTVKTQITLKNAGDVTMAERGHITDAQVRALTVEAVADTGAWTLVIDEDTCQKLGLKLKGPEPGVLATDILSDGTTAVYQMTDGVEVHWQNRQTVCRPRWSSPAQTKFFLAHCPWKAWI